MIAKIISVLVLLFLGQTTHAAQPQLYPTGPSEDASYIRFLNALPDVLEVRSSNGSRIELTPNDSSNPWQAVKANAPLNADLSSNGRSQKVSIRVKPSEFVTVSVIQDIKNVWRVVEVREYSPDFSSLKVAFGLVNLIPDCPSASARLTGKSVVIVDNVAYSTLVRRMVNPVSLGVDVYCGDKRVGESVSLNLRSGERWSLFAYPLGEGVRLMPVLDKLP